MAHPRKLIRQAVIALLIGANTAAGARVTSTRVEPYKRNGIPAISVYTLREPVDPASADVSPRELTRSVKVEIVGTVGQTETVTDGVVSVVPVADACDDLAEQIEAAMDADPTIGDLVVDSILEDTTIEIAADDGRSDQLVGVVILTYSVTYRTSPAAPATLDDFLTVHSDTKVVGGVADTSLVGDTFTVQEPPP